MRRAAVLLLVLAGACAQAPASGVLVERAREAAAMALRPDGELIYGERTTGRVLTADGELLARVRVTARGQRGLLGLDVDDEGTIFASWTRPDGRLVVGAVLPGPQRLVWIGPRSTDLATGGRIAFAPDGSLVVGIGDLEDPGSVSDRRAINGKIVRLDPDGPPDQRWREISYGWNNPFAFTFTPSGRLWVADNAPGNDPERLLLADPVGPATELPERTAPSGIAAVDDETLVVCGYRTRLLLRYRIVADRAQLVPPPLARDCRLGVIRLEDGRIAYATDGQIRFITP